MPVESATYISDLVTTNPATTDDVSDAATHLKLIKSTLKATFPNITGAVSSAQGDIDAAVTARPQGGLLSIAMGTTDTQLTLRGSTDSTVTTSDFTVTNTAGSVTLAVGATNLITLSSAGAVGVTGPVTASDFKTTAGTSILAYLVPSGVIVMWAGVATNIPTGWVLCNGTNNTPDLRDRFIIGAGGSYNPGNTGGATSATPTTSTAGAHAHTFVTGAAGAASGTTTSTSAGSHSHSGSTASYTLTTNDIPAHTHNVYEHVESIGGGSGSIDGVGTSADSEWTATQSTGGGGGHSHGISTDGDHTHDVSYTIPAHSHSISTDGDHTHTITVATVPPYYALCFIMKT